MQTLSATLFHYTQDDVIGPIDNILYFIDVFPLSQICTIFP